MQSEGLIEFMVMIQKPGEPLSGLGRKAFRFAPRVGDFVGLNDEAGIGQAYRVKAMLHSLEPTTTAGDLILEYVSTDLELRKSFQR